MSQDPAKRQVEVSAPRKTHGAPTGLRPLKPRGGGGQISGAYRLGTGGPASYAKSSELIRKAHLCELRHFDLSSISILALATSDFNVRCWIENRRSLAYVQVSF
jgi:hypothetical protein